VNLLQFKSRLGKTLVVVDKSATVITPSRKKGDQQLHIDHLHVEHSVERAKAKPRG